MKNSTTLYLLAVLTMAGCVQLAMANRADEAFNAWAAPRVLAVETTEDPVERILQQLGETAAAGGYGSPPPAEEIGDTPAPPSPDTSVVTTVPPGIVSSPSPAPAPAAASSAAASFFTIAAAAAVAALAF